MNHDQAILGIRNSWQPGRLKREEGGYPASVELSMGQRAEKLKLKCQIFSKILHVNILCECLSPELSWPRLC